MWHAVYICCNYCCWKERLTATLSALHLVLFSVHTLVHILLFLFPFLFLSNFQPLTFSVEFIVALIFQCPFAFHLFRYLITSLLPECPLSKMVLKWLRIPYALSLVFSLEESMLCTSKAALFSHFICGLCPLLRFGSVHFVAPCALRFCALTVLIQNSFGPTVRQLIGLWGNCVACHRHSQLERRSGCLCSVSDSAKAVRLSRLSQSTNLAQQFWPT